MITPRHGVAGLCPTCWSTAPSQGLRRVGIAVAFALALVARLAAQSAAPTPPPHITAGRNVNIAGGTQALSVNPFYVRGDVLGRAQNEPSCAISTRNPQHILCGANDYRMVDVPGVTETQLIRDAWLGVFQSANGGDTWESTLLGGFYRSNTYRDPTPNPLSDRQFIAGADPIVRSGPAGMAFYTGIAFSENRANSALHVTTFADLNNLENDSMPFKAVRTTIVHQVAAPKFIDKPWMFVEAASQSGLTCNIRTTIVVGGVAKQIQQDVPASVIHIVYTVFQDSADTTAEIMYTKSENCGVNFTTPLRLTSISQKKLDPGDDHSENGATVAKALATGSKRIYAVWRRLEKKDIVGNVIEPHAMMISISNNDGGSWSKPAELAQICPFEQSTSTTRFRTTAFPTMTVDATGRVYVAWADRGKLGGQCNADGAARIRVTTSADGVTWSPPFNAVPSSGGEDQIQPSLVFTAGRLLLAWMDFRCDASQVFDHPDVNEADTGLPRPASTDASCTPPLLTNVLRVRHTGDIRAATALPSAVPNFAGDTTMVSEYLKGVAVGTNGQKVQLQWNAVNRRWARKGTVPFMGDYLDIATMPYLPPDPDRGRKSWVPNNLATLSTSLGTVPVMANVLIAWTDNRDMRNGPGVDPNAAGNPPAVPYVVPTEFSGKSLFDPSQTRPVCDPLEGTYKTGTTNQNVYAARATAGWVAGSPGNNKGLGTVQRAFVVFIRNDDLRAARTFKLVAYQPTGGVASFDQFDASQTTRDVVVPRKSSASRTVFVSQKPNSSAKLDRDAVVRVDVVEMVGSTPAQVVPVYLNSDPSAPEIDSPEIDSPEIDSTEVYTPEIDSPEIDSVSVRSPEIDSPEIDSPEIDSPEIDSAAWQALGLQSPEIDSPEIDSPEIDSPEIDSPEIDSSAIRDVTFKLTNTGNTTAQYGTKAFVSKAARKGDVNYQIIVRQKYTIAAVNSSCEPTTLTVSKVLVNELNVKLSTPEIDSPEIDSPEIDSSSFYVPPSESVDIIIRARGSESTLQTLTAKSFELAAQQEAVNTEEAAVGITEPPIITTFLSVTTTALPAGATGTPYSFRLGYSGGAAGPVTWTRPAGNLPPGLTLGPDGLISGTPTAAGTYAFTVRVTDSSGAMAERDLAIVVTTPGVSTLAFVTQPSDTNVGAFITPAVSVRALDGTGAPLPGLAVTVALLGTGTLSGTLTRLTGATGIAVFDNLLIANVATNLRLRATASTFTSADSIPFDVDTPPVASSQDVVTNEDAARAIIVTAIDPDGQPLTFTVLTPPSHGTLSGVSPNLTYSPAGNYNGADEFTFKANDSIRDSNIATVSIALNPVNDAPSFTKGADQTITTSAGPQSLANWATSISTGPIDEAGQAVDFIVTNNNSSLFSSAPSIASNGTLSYTLSGTAGAATVTVRIHDNGGTANGGLDTSAAQTFTITVSAAGPTITTYSNLPAFMVATNSTNATGPLPNRGQIVTNATVGTVTFSPATGASYVSIGAAGSSVPGGDWYPQLRGNEIALPEEHLQVQFAGAVTAMGFRFIEPNVTMPAWGGTPVDSPYRITLYNGPTLVGIVAFNAVDDQLAFVGVSSTAPFTRAVIDDLSNNGDDEYFGEFYTNFNPKTALVVTNTLDNGAGSLRQALMDASAVSGSYNVVFNIPGAGVHTITPQSQLPAIGWARSVDGTTQPDFAGLPLIQISGQSVGAGSGLVVPNEDTTIRGLIINGFPDNGLLFLNNNAKVIGNYIGTDAIGHAPSANGLRGIFVRAGGAVIGGPELLERNIISGNDVGIAVDYFAGSSAGLIEGNYIGTDVSGGAPLGNRHGGILLSGSGVTTVRSNVISANGDAGSGALGNGIEINSVGNRIEHNLIGINADGTTALPNNGNGIVLFAGSNVIGGTAGAASTNVISGNAMKGVYISGASAGGNFVQGNYIGTNITAAAAVPNGTGGVLVDNAPNTVIGARTVTPGSLGGNVISGNTGAGIHISGIGGPGASGTAVVGNIIGLDVVGNLPLGNTGAGLSTANAGVQVGGTDPGDRNIISANLIGISFSNSGGTQNAHVEGNYIGTDISGLFARGNGTGVAVGSAPGVIVGGTTLGAGNVISGNTTGVSVSQISHPVINGTYNAAIQGNVIGLNATGTAALGNGTGVLVASVTGSGGNLIGGSIDSARNVISGNTGVGISLGSGASGNAIKRNYIGPGADAVTPIGNGGNAVDIAAGDSNNVIGGLGDENLIAHNAGHGVHIVSSSVGNSIVSNSIHSNGQLGIELGNDGPTPNDAGDGDTGPNNLQNYPVVVTATPSQVTGTLQSIPATTFLVQVFANGLCDTSGFGEGGALVGNATVVTDGAGAAAFNVGIAVGLGQSITATATNQSTGDSSEFSACVVVTPPSDLTIQTITHAPAVPTTSDTVTLTATVKNVGAGPAPGSVLMLTRGHETAGTPPTLFNVPGLAAGATYTVQREVSGLSAQDYLAAAVADWNADVGESNETNNNAGDPFVVEGLVSQWSAEGNATDATGANTGTLQNGAHFAAGKVGQAFELDGIDDFIALGNPTNLRLQTLTIAAWIKLSTPALTADAAIVAYGSGGYGFSIAGAGHSGDGINPGELLLTQVGSTGVSSTGVVIADTAWHYVAVTRSAGIVVFYLDGVAHQVPTAYNASFSFATNIAIGIRSDTLQNAFPGLIDEVEIHNHALSATDIDERYLSGTGLLSWWKADGDATDSIGPNNGTLQNGASIGAGKVNQAFNLDSGAYVSVSDHPSLHVAALTLEAWINAADISGAHPIITKSQAAGNWNSYMLRLEDGQLRLAVENVNQGRYAHWLTSTTLTAGVWHHIAATWQNVNGDATDAKIYFDGVQQPVAMVSNVGYDLTFAPLYTALPLFFGRDDVPSEDFIGAIDELRLWDRTLTPAEIAAEAEAPMAVSDAAFTTMDSAIQIGVIANDANAVTPSGTALTPQIVAGAAHGTAVVQPNATVQYTPNSGFVGTDSFTYKLVRADGASDTGTVTVTVNAVKTSPIVISEFRFGPGNDEFAELYNNSDSPVTTAATDGTGGWSVSQGGYVLWTIPDGTVIPARGHLVGTEFYNQGPDYNPTGMFQSPFADATWGYFDGYGLPADRGIAIFSTMNSANFLPAYRVDAAGFTLEPNNLYREGSGLTAVGEGSGPYSFVRRMVGRTAQDTDDNAADFALVSADAGNVAPGVPSVLGAPGPENRNGPVAGTVPFNTPISVTALDPDASIRAGANEVRSAGTLILRRKITNAGATAISALRFRITDVSTLGNRTASEAELHGTSIGNDVVPVGEGTVTAYGTMLETPVPQPLGGGLNSSVTVNLPAALAAGASVYVQFAFDVIVAGEYRVDFDTSIYP